MHRRSIREPSLLTGEFSLGAILGNTKYLQKPPFLAILARNQGEIFFDLFL
jgi:hypothetical protein